MNECIFCKIVKGEIPAEKIYEDDNFLVILDAFPVLKGQILLLTKKHISSYVFDLDDDLYSKLMILAKKFAKVLDETFNPIKTGMIIEGLEVPHVHIKLLPLTDEKGYGMKSMKPFPSKDELRSYAEKIRKNI